jgi:hypothetical protein
MDTKATMTGDRRIIDLTPRCPSVYQGQLCVMKIHVGTFHWNGSIKPETNLQWTDADVIRELQERVQNLAETNRLYFT